VPILKPTHALIVTGSNFFLKEGKMKSTQRLLFTFVFLVAFDQIAKNIFSASVCNKYLAWSIPVSGGLFYIAWIIIVSTLAYFFFKTKKQSQKIFLILIFAGASSNLVDRIRVGCVIDYIDLKFWPVFNLADVYITVGIIALLIFQIRNPKH
jgi:signal peptidase II